uniref:Major facilitator superfamily (MFS) profile domain-containing protein n=1 Tax=Ditylenchus dipsaci TaxID=166011 RepID=A0A915EV61_9BILA
MTEPVGGESDLMVDVVETDQEDNDMQPIINDNEIIIRTRQPRESNISSVPTKNLLFLAVLIALNLLNYMDRFTVASTLIDIQAYYDIGDSSAGLIVTTFVWCYMIAAPVFGYFGDRYNRKFVICVGLSIWILAVLLSSICKSFALFLLCRAIVGVVKLPTPP